MSSLEVRHVLDIGYDDTPPVVLWISPVGFDHLQVEDVSVDLPPRGGSDRLLDPLVVDCRVVLATELPHNLLSLYLKGVTPCPTAIGLLDGPKARNFSTVCILLIGVLKHADQSETVLVVHCTAHTNTRCAPWTLHILLGYPSLIGC